MSRWREAVLTLSEGDVIIAEFADGVPQVCMVTRVSTWCVHAWDFPRGFEMMFDRDTGQGRFGPDRVASRVVCTAPMPADSRLVFAGMYERYRFGEGEGRFRLTADEKAALQLLPDFVAANLFAAEDA